MTDERNIDHLVSVVMGSSGYLGSMAESEDRKAGIKVGEKIRFCNSASLKPNSEVIATIYKISIDSQGDPLFSLLIDDDDITKCGFNYIVARREQIYPLGF